MTGVSRILVAIVLLAGGVQSAAAQSDGPGLRPHHLTLAAGLTVAGGYPVGNRNAEIRRNARGAPDPFTLFRADSSFDGANGLEARVGFALSRALAIEVGGTYTKPELGISIDQDSESADAVRIVEKVSQYTVDVSGVFQLSRVALGSRARPYATAGAGYLRQIHEDRLLAETGRVYHVGGGIRYWLRGGSAIGRALGIRADARYVRRAGGIEFEDASRGYPVFSVLGFAGF
jgi:hypothetical protein